MWWQIENMGFLNYVFSFSCWNISLEKISGLMIMEKKDLYIFLTKCFMIHTLIQFFLFPWLKWGIRFWEKCSIDTSLASAWSICQQNKMWKNYISIKVITFSKQLVIIYYVALHWTKMLFSAWLLEGMIYFHKLVKNSNIYFLCCLIGENNTPCWNTCRFELNYLTCQFSDLCIHLLI